VVAFGDNHQNRLASSVGPGAERVPAQAKEAYLMALIGFLAWHQVPLLTGPHVPGRISPGAARLALPPPAAPPTGLLIRTA